MTQDKQRKPVVALESYSDYLAGRNKLVAAREGFFHAIRTSLHPDQRVDARLLGDRLWESPARVIADEEWVVNPARGYVTVMENPDAGRIFRLSVLQLGEVLRVGLRLPAWHANSNSPAMIRLRTAFPYTQPTLSELTTSEVLVDWVFDVKDLYTCPIAMEGAIYRVGAVFEVALQSLVPASKEHLQ